MSQSPLESTLQTAPSQSIQMQSSPTVGMQQPPPKKKRKLAPLVHQQQHHEEQQEEPLTKEVGTQSLYRESEAQTDPYTPDVYVPKGNPEVLALAELKWGQGLPIGPEELKKIDAIRRRRDVEANLPMGTDKSAFEQRVKMLKDLEMAEWEDREEKIRKEQDERLEKVKSMISARERTREQNNHDRLLKMKDQIYEKLDTKLKKIHKKRRNAYEKTKKKHANPQNTLKRRDVIEEQTNFKPPEARDGRVNLNKPIAYEIRPTLLTDPLGVQEVEIHHMEKMTRIKRPSTKKKTLGKTSGERKQESIQKDVEFARKLQLERISEAQAIQQRTNHLDRYRATPRVHRPPTPTLEFADDEDDLENSVITVQKLMRGRCAQNDFFIGKERALELIRELQEVEKVVRKENDLKGRHPELEAAQREKEKNQLVENIVDNVRGEVISKTLDYLSKQLIREEEMAKIESLRAAAEMERRAREAVELGKRQKEEAQRRRENTQYGQVVATSDDTIDSYLQNIFSETADKLSYNQALKQVLKETKSIANKFNKNREKEKKLKSNAAPVSNGQEIRDLISRFLLPQVKREVLRDQVQQDQKKYVKAVHESFQEVVDQVVEEASTTTNIDE
eukprot:CAMPEP_0117424556 /NCGR_PEP_ID=MMETSP0758-20121206/4947_1 /TAXON_ID=63605 /ORGANISM="Percolomonas cosmopolitus, Strain AE-1 (ATCC 50343)" /LENGTH=618 /DNA_ID=CAMNT_0005208397 /DNA_START=182 /DNA_END=2038 /DNA_ORIENTATION=-